MNGADFLDTNVIVYAYDSSAPRKQEAARQLLLRALKGEFVLSTQVLSEAAATFLHKLTPPMTTEAVADILDLLSPIQLISPDSDLVRRAVQTRARYGIHFYDGMIVAAAERAGSLRILSEDLNAGQPYFGIKVENPFA